MHSGKHSLYCCAPIFSSRRVLHDLRNGAMRYYDSIIRAITWQLHLQYTIQYTKDGVRGYLGSP